MAMEVGIPQDEAIKRRTMSRREFLKLAGMFVGGGLFELWRRRNGPAAILSSLVLMDVNVEVPPEFKHEEVTSNPFFENPDQLLKRSLQIYKSLQTATPNQYPNLTCRIRKNYISTTDVVQRYIKLSKEDAGETTDDELLSVALKSLSPTFKSKLDQSQGGETLGFSASGIHNAEELLVMDPGSGFVTRAIKEEFGVSREVFYLDHSTQVQEGFFPSKVSEPIGKRVTLELKNILRHFKNERQKSQIPLDLASGLAYFYGLNKGDFYTGLWDAVMFFKLLVRNNLESLVASPEYDKSILLGELFKDPFSPKNSLNWLAEKYREKGIGLDNLLLRAGGWSNVDYKDYMIINRSGGIYHGLNIVAWAAFCMDPVLVQVAVPMYYGGEQVIGTDFITEHGKIKIESDVSISMRAPEIKRVAVQNVNYDL